MAAFAVAALVALTACAAQLPTAEPPAPLQSPILPPGNVTVLPTVAQVATVAVVQPTPAATITPSTTPALVPTVVRSPFVLPGGTPDTRATSQSVILTITALAATPTRGPTARPTRPIGAGGSGRVTRAPTATLDPSGISLLSLSSKVYRGGAATLSIRTTAGAQCAIGAEHTQADGTIATISIPNAARVAGSDGGVAWIWNVGNDAPLGKLTLRANCGDAGSAEYVIEIES